MIAPACRSFRITVASPRWPQTGSITRLFAVLGRDDVLDGERDPLERSPVYAGREVGVSLARRRQRRLVRDLDERAELPVGSVRPRQQRLGQSDGTNRTASERLGGGGDGAR